MHVEFEAIPHLIKVSSAARFYLKQLSPKLRTLCHPAADRSRRPGHADFASGELVEATVL